MRSVCRYVSLLTLLAVLGSVVAAQRLVADSANGTIAAAKASTRIGKVFGSGEVSQSTAAIDLKKITYTSVNEAGKRVNLTGLVAWPKGGAAKGLVVFCHGTIQDRDNSPSKWKGEENGSEAETAVLAFAARGYAVAIPDYLGLGDHMATHPYPRNKVNSQSVIDIIEPARYLAQKTGYPLGPKLFVTGYSEGGGIAMAAMQKLETIDRPAYRVERAAPVSGPYDVAGATREFMLVQPTDQVGFVVRLYLLSYASYYLRKHANVKITDYFKPAMANSIWLNYSRNPSDQNLIKALGLTAVLMRSKNSIFNVITPRFKRALETIDKTDPLVAALVDDNVFDWAPRTPMLLINLDGDGVVNPENTTNAINAMRGRGVGRDTLRRYIIRDPQLNHVTAVPAAMAAARIFFDQGFSGVRDAQ